MLKLPNRLKKDKDFDNVFKNGKSSYDKILGVKIVLNNRKNSRFGFLVSNKISKKAVARNKIKRRIRKAVEDDIKIIKDGHDCVIVALPLVLDKTFLDIKNSVRYNFKKIGLYKD